MANENRIEKIGKISGFEKTGNKIKNKVKAFALDNELLKQMEPDTLINLNILNKKSEQLITKLNRLQQYFMSIKKISEDEPESHLTGSQGFSPIEDGHLRINRLASKAKDTISDIQLDIADFSLSYKNIEKNKNAISDIILIIQEFMDKVFLAFEDLTAEAEEVYSRLSNPVEKKKTEHRKYYIFNWN